MSIVYEKDIVDPPKHLDVAFFEDVAENALRKTNLKIDKIHFTMGSSTGENYCSQIYRVKLQYSVQGSTEVKSLMVIIKSMPHTQATEFLLDLQVFLKEKITYFEVLPRMEMFLEDGQRFGARLYHSLKDPVRTLVFEDLGTNSFEMASRERGLDEAHCNLVMQRLAKFHAISMVLAKKDPEIIENFNSGMLGNAALDRDDNMLLRYFGANAATLIELVKKWQGYEKITKKLQNYEANLYDNLLRTSAPLSDEIKVLNHGDLWVNNILFKYDSARKVQDLIFVDFQMSVWGSPGLDLNYFFYTSLELNILQHKREELLRVYHNVLSETLRKLNYAEVPSFQQILEEVKRRESYGFFANYGIYPVVSMDKDLSGDSNLENYANEDFMKNKLMQMFSSKRLEAMMRYTLKHFDEMRIWDD